MGLILSLDQKPQNGGEIWFLDLLRPRGGSRGGGEGGSGNSLRTLQTCAGKAGAREPQSVLPAGSDVRPSSLGLLGAVRAG